MPIRPRKTKHHGTHYQVIIDLGRDPVTKQRLIRTTMCGSEKEAKRLEAQMRVDLAAGKLGPRPVHTVADLCAAWLDDYASAKSPLTYDCYARSVRLYIGPHLGHLKASELTTERVRAWVTRLRKAGKGHRTLSLALLNLHQAVAWGVTVRHMAYDVTEGVRVPKPADRGEEMHVWTAEEAQRFLEVADRHDATYGPVFRVALCTGLRSGELRGLRWSDIDWEQGELRVRQAVGPGPEQKGLEVKDLKNKHSRRDVLVDAAVLDALREHHVRQHAWRLKLGPVWQGDAYKLVFCSQVGTPLSASNLWKLYRRLRTEAAVPPIKIHDQRHTHITWALEEHADLKTVSERAGHSSPAVTMGIYQHVGRKLQQELVEKVSGKLSRRARKERQG